MGVTSDFLASVSDSGGPLFIPSCSLDDEDLFANDKASLLYYDVETTGLNVWHDRILQFAALRRGLASGDERSTFETLVKPTADTSLAPAALATHGIRLETAAAQGIPEPELARRVHEAMRYRLTTSVGFNSTGFDSLLIRALMYRNFHDPYLHEWSDGCARWDLLPVVRTFLALVPNALKWVPKEGGGASLTLVDLATAANIDFPNAHDALADTRTLAELDAGLRQRSEPLWRAAFSRRRKDLVMRDIGQDWTPHPMLFVTGYVPAASRCIAIVAPVVSDPARQATGLVWDLRHDPTILGSISAEEMAERLYGDGDSRLPFFRIRANANPQIFPLALDQAQTLVAPEALRRIAQHYQSLSVLHDHVVDRLSEAMTLCSIPDDEDPQDVEAALYEGFMAQRDLILVNQARDASCEHLVDAMRQGQFDDWRTSELLWRYTCRHHPDLLTGQEMARWEKQVVGLLTAHDQRRAQD